MRLLYFGATNSLLQEMVQISCRLCENTLGFNFGCLDVKIVHDLH